MLDQEFVDNLRTLTECELRSLQDKAMENAGALEEAAEAFYAASNAYSAVEYEQGEDYLDGIDLPRGVDYWMLQEVGDEYANAHQHCTDLESAIDAIIDERESGGNLPVADNDGTEQSVWRAHVSDTTQVYA